MDRAASNVHISGASFKMNEHVSIGQSLFKEFYPPVRFNYPILRPSSIFSTFSNKFPQKSCGIISNALDRLIYFDARDVHSIKVFRDEQKFYWLFYNSSPRRILKGLLRLPNGVGLATSKDGMFFKKYFLNPILKPCLHGWDSGYIWKCSPLKVGKKFMLYYGAVSKNGKSGIGLALSCDGLNWIKTKTPLLTPSSNETSVGSPAVMYDKSKGIFVMLYLSKPLNGIGLAYSGDGLRWKKYKNNPVILPMEGSFEEYMISPFCLLKIGDCYIVFYEGMNDKKSANWKIGIAYSHDLINWIRDNRNPILEKGLSGNFDDHFVSDPSAVIDQDILRLYYGCKNKNGFGYGGLALIPLKPTIENYFTINGRMLNGMLVNANNFTDGVICPEYEIKSVYMMSYTSGEVEIQTIKGDKWRCYDKVYLHKAKVLKYQITENEVVGMRLKFNCQMKVTAKWILEKYISDAR